MPNGDHDVPVRIFSPDLGPLDHSVLLFFHGGGWVTGSIDDYLKGAKTAEWRLKIIEGVVPADRVVACAKKMGVTVTAFLTAVLICAIKEEMSKRDKGKTWWYPSRLTCINIFHPRQCVISLA